MNLNWNYTGKEADVDKKNRINLGTAVEAKMEYERLTGTKVETRSGNSENGSVQGYDGGVREGDFGSSTLYFVPGTGLCKDPIPK
jgi:hypothetical protein